MGAAQNRRCRLEISVNFDPIEPHIGSPSDEVGKDRVREVFHIKDALSVNGHDRVLLRLHAWAF